LLPVAHSVLGFQRRDEHRLDIVANLPNWNEEP
jgi:hypothetical protein